MLTEFTSGWGWQAFLFALLITEWAIRLVMLFIVPKNRHPSSALTWLLLIMITPTIGTLLYIMMGNPKLPKIRRHAQVRADARTQKALQTIKAQDTALEKHPYRFQTTAELATSVGGLPVFAGNEVEFITDYKEIIRTHAEAIDAAKEYVHLAYFILIFDNETEEVFAAMERAVKRGVNVRVLFDRFATKRYPPYKKTLKKLDEIGVNWHFMLPYNFMPGKNFTRFDLRNHRKLLIIDGHTAYTGSANIIKNDYHKGPRLVYEDMLIKLRGPAVWQLHTVFRADWYAETGETLSTIIDGEQKLKHAGTVPVQVLPSGPAHADENNLMIYTHLFHGAKKRISIVVPYLVPDEPVMTALIAAAKRGVDVTIINSETIDKLLTGHAQRSYYGELLKSGVNIYLRKKPIFLHNKQVLIDDDLAVVGSSNLDIRSFELSMEVTLLMYDAKIVEQLDVIEESYLADSFRVSEVAWHARPLRLRMLDSIARLTAALQ